MAISELEKEKREILLQYKLLLKNGKQIKDDEDIQMIRKAFDLALEAHRDMRRKSGEPYIYHPIAVARIVSEEIGLGTTSIVCALLHDTVEDTDLTLEDMQRMFGDKVAKIIDGLTKISGVFSQTDSIQAENFRKMLLTLSDDVRVILIKLADRLHNMRTLDSMRQDKQLKIAYETLYLYAPLAHRLGLYNIKSELEDLGLKYTEPADYNLIEQKLKKTKAVRTRFINQFILPIKRALTENGLASNIYGRTKSIFSIWNKMKTKNVPFEEVYDVFAIRIVLDSLPENEKTDCWKAYSLVTDFYRPNPDRLRDWISNPRGNGYESLHTTVMSPSGKWVEVQIRTERMDEIAEKGYAAHWKYKDQDGVESTLDVWITKIRELLENSETNALDFIDDFKLNLFSDEIYVFTPKGELKILPAGCTTLDFAFDIHSQIGAKCIGAKVNHKLVSLSYKLNSGDQVEIITSKKQKPKEDWLNFVITAKAKSQIKSLLKDDKRIIAEDGKEQLERKLRHLKITFNAANVKKIATFLKQSNELEMFYKIGSGDIDLQKLKNLKTENGKIKASLPIRKKEKSLEQIVTNVRGKADLLVVGEETVDLDYKLSPCCNPIPGDDVFGFITINEGIKIHRINCPNAQALMANYAYRIVQAKWTNQKSIAFLAGIKLTGIDQVGIVNEITQIISSELNVNMRSIKFDTDDGIFEGTIFAFVHDTSHLNGLIKKLKKIDGIIDVFRIDK